MVIALAILPVASAEQVHPPADLAERIDAYVQPYVAGNNFSGTILVAQGNKVLFQRGYGMANYELAVPNTPDIRFHIASTSKSFTAAAILMLEQRGRMSVNDAISNFIPDYPKGDTITVHHLLTHTSGIPNVNDLPDYAEHSTGRMALPEIIQLFKEKPLAFEPGARFKYSNSNYNLLAWIIEKVSGKSYGEFLSENIFRPLAMNDTGNDDGSDQLIPKRAYGYVPVGMNDLGNAPFLNWSIKTGNGSLFSTVADLYRWDRALYTDKILGKAERDKMFKDYGGFGYGWFVRERFGHRVTAINGRSPGFTSSLERFVDDDICIALTANTYSGLTQAMADDLAAIVFGEKYNVPRTQTSVSSAALSMYPGRYQFGPDFSYNPNGVVKVASAADGLRLESGGTVSYLIPQSQNEFIDRLYGGTVSFQERAGKVETMTWSFGKTFAAKRLP